MTPSELKEWLGSDESAGSGWSKDDGSGETVGHERFADQQVVPSEQSHVYFLKAAERSSRSSRRIPRKTPEDTKR